MNQKLKTFIIVAVALFLIGGFFYYLTEMDKKIEITNVENQEPFIKIISPSKGELLDIGKEYEITWESGNIDTVSFFLVKEGESDVADIIKEGIQADAGKYLWTIPEDNHDISLGGQFRIMIFKNDDFMPFAYSDWFEISKSLMTIKIPLIVDNPNESEIEEAKRSGRIVGCQDVIFYLEKEIPYTPMTLTAVYKELFSLDKFVLVDGKKYINPIHDHIKDGIAGGSLEFDKVIIENGIAHVYLLGNYVTIGTCEPPRTEGVLKFAATQFDSVNDVEIYLNDQKMIFIHGGRGL